MTPRALIALANVHAAQMKAMYGSGDDQPAHSGRPSADEQKSAIDELIRLSKLQ
jgi:hypothetical protein